MEWRSCSQTRGPDMSSSHPDASRIEKAILAAWDRVDTDRIRAEVAERGLDSFVKKRVRTVRVSGAAAGTAFFVAGPVGMVAAGVVDFTNLMYRQLEITVAVMSLNSEKITTFDDVMKVTAKFFTLTARQVGGKVTVAKISGSVVGYVAARIAVRYATTVPLRAIPVIGVGANVLLNGAYLKNFANEFQAHAPRILGLIDDEE